MVEFDIPTDQIIQDFGFELVVRRVGEHFEKMALKTETPVVSVGERIAIQLMTKKSQHFRYKFMTAHFLRQKIFWVKIFVTPKKPILPQKAFYAKTMRFLRKKCIL